MRIMDLEQLIIPGAFVFVGLAAEGITSYLFIRGLRKHRRMRQFFGDPTLLSEGSLVEAFPTNLLLCTQDYQACPDPGGIAFCDRHRMSMIAGFAIAWICLPVAIVYLAMV